MTLFGFTVVKWPTADKLEKAHSALMDRIKKAEDEFATVAGALAASIDLQTHELARINALRSKLQNVLK